MIGEMHTDGGARPTNPGHAGIGVVIQIQDNGETHTLARYLGRYHSNNYAEFVAMRVGVSFAHHLGIKDLYIYSDSKLVVKSLLGEFKLKDRQLQIILDDTLKLLAEYFDGLWTITHTRREGNKAADALCTAAILWGMWNPYVPGIPRPVAPVDPFAVIRTAIHRSM
jgi:ribonuclease HI